MPERIFLQVLNMSFTASFVILAVIAARLLLKKAPRVISYALWAVVLFRLVCPFSFESAISLLPIKTNPIPANIGYQPVPKIDTGIQIVNNAVNSILPPATAGGSISDMQISAFLGSIVWQIGIAALLIYSVVSLIKLNSRLKDATHEKDCIYTSNGLASPFVMGIFRPKIYLPAKLSDDERQYIILHEQTHIKRFDHLVKIVCFFVLCLHWFNPLVWAAFFISGRDMEMSCDEAVIKALGSGVKKEYSSSLLTLATGRRIVGGTPLAFGEGDTKSRIKNVLSYKKPAFWVIAVSIIAVAAVGIGLAANPKSDRASMQWAKALQAGDIASVELVTSYGDENKRYQRYEPEQFFDIVKLVNGSRGNYLPQPEPIAGNGETLYITTLDGVRHSVGNNANVYLKIDGDSFEMSRFAVDGWGWYRDGNAPVPEGFWKEDTSAPEPTPEPTLNDYNGLSQEEYEGLEAERAKFEAMSAQDQQLLLESGGVSCAQFEHLWWEDSIDLSLIRLVGADAFENWAKVQREQNQCSDIYSFAKQFELNYPALEKHMLDNGLTELYPLERLKTRAAVFGVPNEGSGEAPDKVASVVNSYYAGQSSPAFNMLQKSVFQNWVEYDNSGAVNPNLVNPKWNFESFTQYHILNQNMEPTSKEELYYCTFSDENNKSGYVVVSYLGDSLSKIERAETPYRYDLQANLKDVMAKLAKSGVDLSTATAARVQVVDATQNSAREAIRITDGDANQYLYYFDELTAAP